MKIYVCFEDQLHKESGLTSIGEAGLETWLKQVLGFAEDSNGLKLAQEKISHDLSVTGVSAIWTDKGTATFISEEVIRNTRGVVLMNDFFSESSRKRFVDKVIEELRAKGLTQC